MEGVGGGPGANVHKEQPYLLRDRRETPPDSELCIVHKTGLLP